MFFFNSRKLDTTVALMVNYKNPSFRGFYKANIKAEPSWQELSMDFISDQDVSGRWELWGFSFLA